MLVDVRDILKARGRSKRVAFSQSPAECGVYDSECAFREPVEVSAELTNINGVIRAKGEISAEYEAVCARCLAPVSCAIKKAFDEEYVPAGALRGISSEDAEVYEYAGKELDLSLAVRDAILLSLPIRHLCNEDCRELCPRCGKGLSGGECGCEASAFDERFQVLQGFFD